MRRLKYFFLSSSPIIQRLSQFLVSDPGLLDGIGRVGVTELTLYCDDIAGEPKGIIALDIGGYDD